MLYLIRKSIFYDFLLFFTAHTLLFCVNSRFLGLVKNNSILNITFLFLDQKSYFFLICLSRKMY